MNIKIYYGGRGVIDDPTIYVLNRMQEVLEELRVNVTRINLFEHKNSILTLPQTLKDADGIILATTVEWLGIGGDMQTFLDACWLYGDKDVISNIYMCPVVMSTTYGEREAKLNLTNAWEILGGLPCSGLCGYIENTSELEKNEQYTSIIDRKAENLYRVVRQRVPSFPASNMAVKQKVSTSTGINLTPQESEELSRYVSDDGYVRRQKEDIQELASFFKSRLDEETKEPSGEYTQVFEKVFKPSPGFEASYSFNIGHPEGKLILKVDGSHMECSYGEVAHATVEGTTEGNVMDDIVHGRMTFQRAFMSGAMTVKGDFKALRMLDQVFPFERA